MSDSKKTWVYVLWAPETDEKNAEVYVGIGDLRRPFQGHSKEYERLLKRDDARVEVFDIPFTSRKDAEMAESLGIRLGTILTQASRGCNVLNKAGRQPRRAMSPVVRKKAVDVRVDQCRATIFVPINPMPLDGRPAINTSTSWRTIAPRVEGDWNLKKALREAYPLRRLIAFSTGMGSGEHRILADYDLDSTHPVASTGDRLNLADPTNPDPRGLVGALLVGLHPNTQDRCYSPDIKA